MTSFILFMHDDTPASAARDDQWAPYLTTLRAAGAFEGGSAIGDGICVSKSHPHSSVTRQITGYIRINARDLEAARALVIGNPVYEAGGTVEIRELPASG